MVILSIWFLCPSEIASVLDELRRNRLELIHSPTSDKHRARRSTASATSLTGVVTQTWQSSALMQLQNVVGNDLTHIGGVQHEQQGADNRPLRYSELHWTDGRQLTIVGDLLHCLVPTSQFTSVSVELDGKWYVRT